MPVNTQVHLTASVGTDESGAPDLAHDDFAELHVVDLPEFERDFVEGRLSTRLQELPYFVVTPAVLRACKITANTFSPIIGNDGGSIFWCEKAHAAGHVLASTALEQDGLVFAPPSHERRQDNIVGWGAPWEPTLDVVNCIETFLQLALGSRNHRLRNPVLITNQAGSPDQQLHRDL